MTNKPEYRQINEIFQETPINEFINKRVSQLPKDLPEDIKLKLLQDAKFFGENGVTTDDPIKYLEMLKKLKSGRKALKDINVDMKKEKVTKAYPNYDNYMHHEPPRDTTKWIKSVREMYYQIHKGISRDQALKTVTSGWDTMEKLDFVNWLKFYQEGAQKKYKAAQVSYWEDPARVGYFVPMQMPELKQPVPNQAVKDIDYIRDPATHPDVMQDEKRKVIEKQRQKIIGRLDSTEKLLRSQEGQMFAGSEFEMLLEVIYQLKKKIQMVNKISTSTKLYEDMIIREANVLSSKGFKKASEFLSKFSQETPSPAPPPNPTDNGGQPGMWPGDAPGQTPVGNNPPLDMSPPAKPQDAPLAEGMEEFLDGLDTSNKTVIKENNESDDIEVADADADLFVSEAQEAAPQPPSPAPTADIEVEEDAAKPTDPEIAAGRDFDAMLDQTFKNLTVADVVSKLEDLAKIFKTREIPRQLAMVDMMLDKLGLASFFPSLAEATNKSLESNQYMSTRIEDILSRLRGTLETKDIDLKNETATPGDTAAQQRLQGDLEKEQQKKKMRKEIEEQALTGKNKTTPEIEVTEDLSQPAALQNELPVPAAPAPVPPPAPAR